MSLCWPLATAAAATAARVVRRSVSAPLHRAIRRHIYHATAASKAKAVAVVATIACVGAAPLFLIPRAAPALFIPGVLVVPEPSSAAVLGMGLVGLAIIRRKSHAV